MSTISISKKELIQLLDEIEDQAVAENLNDESLKELYGKLDLLLHCGIINEELHNCIDRLYNVIYSRLNPDYKPVINLSKFEKVSYQVYYTPEFTIIDNCKIAIKIFESEKDTYKLMKTSPFIEDETENDDFFDSVEGM